MEELSSNNLIKIINHSHNQTNQREGKHSLLNVFHCSWNIKNWKYFYIGVYVFIYNTLPKYTL